MKQPPSIIFTKDAARLCRGNARSTIDSANVARVLFVLWTCLLRIENIASSADQGLTGEPGEHECYFSGGIVSSDIGSLRESIRQGCRLIYLSSPGGDVATALTLGRMIRKAEMQVGVLHERRCASACIFLYAGGVKRFSSGELLIHRPYLSDSALSFEETQRQFAQLEQKAKTYLGEMHVNPSLFDRMMTIAPENAVPLKRNELGGIGLGTIDQVYEEYIENKRAVKVEMTKQQWLRKKKDSIEACGEFGGYYKSKEEAEERIECWRRRFPEYFTPIN